MQQDGQSTTVLTSSHITVLDEASGTAATCTVTAWSLQTNNILYSPTFIKNYGAHTIMVEFV